MAANIDTEIQEIQQASRGEDVRDAIVAALIAINDSDSSATTQLVNRLLTQAINELDVSAAGGNGKFIKSISESDGKISAQIGNIQSQPIEDSSDPVTSGALFNSVATLQSNFQDGVDSVYNAVVAKGSTPVSHSLSDVIAGIAAIPEGGDPVIHHTDNWVKTYNVGSMYFRNRKFLWTDGTDLYYSDGYWSCIFDKNALTFLPIQIDIENKDLIVSGADIIYDGINTYSFTGRGTYIFDKSNMVFKRMTSPPISTSSSTRYPLFWNDGDTIYFSNGASQWVYDKTTKTWSAKTWNGLTSFDGCNIWTDGENIYYSYNSTHYTLSKTTSTWEPKTWSGFSSFTGQNIWTDGDNIYYSDNSTHYILNKELSVWYNKTWSGIGTFSGYYIWTDGDNIYYSSTSRQYVLDKATSTWTAKTWVGLTNFEAHDVYIDSNDIYCLTNNNIYILDKTTSTWTMYSWVDTAGVSYAYGRYLWTDGDNIYYSMSDNQYVVDFQNYILLRQCLSIDKDYIWTDEENIYYSYGSSSGSPHYIFDTSLCIWRSKTWNGLTSFDGQYIWTDGTDIYYSKSSTQYILDKTTSTWSTKTWSGLTSFDGSYIKNINGVTWFASSVGTAYRLDKPNSAWNKVSNWNPLTLNNVFEYDGVFYGFYNSSSTNIHHYKYESRDDEWVEINFVGPFVLEPSCIWTDGDNIYYSNDYAQYVLNKETHIWTKKSWLGVTRFSGKYIWTDGENIYYSDNSAQYILNKESSLWYTKTWTGLTSFDRSYIWNDGETIYYVTSQNAYKLEPTTS